MTDQVKKSALAEWGSRPKTGREKLLFRLGGLVLVVAVVAVWLWAASAFGEHRQELEDKLNSRYREQIEVGVQRVGNRTLTTFVIDGTSRPDCNATGDGYMECSDDPQPTLEDE